MAAICWGREAEALQGPFIKAGLAVCLGNGVRIAQESVVWDSVRKKSQATQKELLTDRQQHFGFMLWQESDSVHSVS